jgi:hypothetical protein
MFYPYLVLSVTDTTSERYLRRGIEAVIIDSGVYTVFKKLGLREYPGGPIAWMLKIVSLYNVAKRYVSSVYAVVPDYPVDYRGNPIPNNVEKTIRNIELALDSFPEVSWIIPVQGRPDSVSSVAKTIELLKQLGLLKSDYVAVAPNCTSKSIEYMRRLAFTVRALLPGKRVHVFGVPMRMWSAIERYVDSTDTIALNSMCRKLFGRLCRTKIENTRAWETFLEELRKRGYL